MTDSDLGFRRIPLAAIWRTDLRAARWELGRPVQRLLQYIVHTRNEGGSGQGGSPTPLKGGFQGWRQAVCR